MLTAIANAQDCIFEIFLKEILLICNIIYCVINLSC